MQCIFTENTISVVHIKFMLLLSSGM